MSVMMVQTKCKLNNTELFLKLFHIQCKEIGNNRTYALKLPSRSEKIQISREYDTPGWISQSKQSIPISDWRAEPLSFHL